MVDVNDVCMVCTVWHVMMCHVTSVMLMLMLCPQESVEILQSQTEDSLKHELMALHADKFGYENTAKVCTSDIYSSFLCYFYVFCVCQPPLISDPNKRPLLTDTVAASLH